MTKSILYLFISLLSISSFKSQVKLYNIDLPFFDKKKLVKPDKSIKTTNRINNYITQITEYNSKGQFHGAVIGFRNDQSVSFIKYYHNNVLVYSAQPFINGREIERLYNYNDNGSYDGIQAYTYLNRDTNQWIKRQLSYDNGRLISIDNKFNFPNYTVNFKNGKLNGEFYFYENANCSCNYYGISQDGQIKTIMKIDVRDDLSLRLSNYVISNEFINSTDLPDFRTPTEQKIPITLIPVIVENNDVNIPNEKEKIIFKKELDWMSILVNPENYDPELELDWSKASVGLPSSYPLPQKQH